MKKKNSQKIFTLFVSSFVSWKFFCIFSIRSTRLIYCSANASISAFCFTIAADSDQDSENSEYSRAAVNNDMRKMILRWVDMSGGEREGGEKERRKSSGRASMRTKFKGEVFPLINAVQKLWEHRESPEFPSKKEQVRRGMKRTWWQLHHYGRKLITK